MSRAIVHDAVVTRSGNDQIIVPSPIRSAAEIHEAIARLAPVDDQYVAPDPVSSN